MDFKDAIISKNALNEFRDAILQMETKNKAIGKPPLRELEYYIGFNKLSTYETKEGINNVIEYFKNVMSESYDNFFEYDYIVSHRNLLDLAKIILAIDGYAINPSGIPYGKQRKLRYGKSMRHIMTANQNLLLSDMLKRQFPSEQEEMDVYRDFMRGKYAKNIFTEEAVGKHLDEMQERFELPNEEIQYAKNKEKTDAFVKMCNIQCAMNGAKDFCPITWDYLHSCVINCMINYDAPMTDSLKIMHSVIGVFLNFEEQCLSYGINAFSYPMLTNEALKAQEFQTEENDERMHEIPLLLAEYTNAVNGYNTSNIHKNLVLITDIALKKPIEMYLSCILSELYPNKQQRADETYYIWRDAWVAALRADASSAKKVIENKNQKYYDLLRESAVYAYTIIILIRYIDFLQKDARNKASNATDQKEQLKTELDKKCEEVTRLRQQLAKTEQDARADERMRMNGRIAELEKENKLYESKLNKQEDELKALNGIKQENVAMRNYIETMDVLSDAISQAEEQNIEKALPQEDVVVIGGHDSWQNKLKEKFPKWQFIKGSERAWDSKKINKKYVVVNTTHLGHPTYYKVCNNLKNQKLIYTGKVNIQQALQEIYTQL